MRMTCRIVAVFLASVMFLAGYGGKPERSHYEKAGAFSYEPPAGWQVAEFPGLKYRIAHGSAENEFAPNINVVDESYAGTLTEYVEANLKNMEKAFVKLKVLTRKDFKTQDNEAGVKMVTENEQQGRILRQTFFFLASGRRKYVVTCSALAEDGAKLDKSFAESVETFRMH